MVQVMLRFSGLYYRKQPQTTVEFQHLWRVMDDIQALQGDNASQYNSVISLLTGYVQTVTGPLVDNTDPQNPVVSVAVDGVTITGDGSTGNPLVSSGSDTYQVKATATDAIPTFLDQKIACLTDSTITVTPSNISGFEYINIKVLWSPRTVFESRNADSVTLYPGDPVYIMGVDPITNIVDVGLADASNPAKMPAVGVVWQITMSPSTLGGVIMTGLYGAVVTDPIDGVTPVTGDKLYVKAGGGLTTTMPTGGDIVQLVGVVGNVSTLVTDGSIIVGELLSGSSGSTVTLDIINPFLLMGG